MSTFRRTVVEHLTLFVLLLPLLWLNLHGTHDWGGDFAQYIQQSLNIASGTPHADTHYLYNSDYPELAPPAYSVGFPLLLTPISAIWGNDMMTYQIYLTVLLIVLGLLTYNFLRRFFTWSIAGVAVLLFLYNPATVAIKEEILPTIPFALFLLLALSLYLNVREGNLGETKSVFRAFAIGTLIGYAMLLNDIAAVVLLAMMIDLGRNDIRFTGGLMGASLGLFLLFGQILFPVPEGASAPFFENGFRETINASAEYYLIEFQKFFTPERVQLDVFPLLTRALLIAFFLIGLLTRLLKRPGVLEFTFIGYTLALVMMPQTDLGFHAWLPVFPIVAYYIVVGAQRVQLPRTPKAHWGAVVALLAVGLPYQNYLEYALRADVNAGGPQSIEAQQAFAFIKSETPEDAVIVFVKPRVLGLYGERDAFAQHPDEELRGDFDYVLLSRELPDAPTERFLSRANSTWRTVFRNERFTLYAPASSTLR